MTQAADRNRIALFPWGGVLEDFVAPIGLDHVRFAEEMSGGWLFGYVEALRRQGVETVIVALSRAVGRLERRVNPRTGTVTFLPPIPPIHRGLRRWPGDADDPDRPRSRGRRLLQDLVRYAATPGPRVSDVLRSAGCGAIPASTGWCASDAGSGCRCSRPSKAHRPPPPGSRGPCGGAACARRPG